MVRTVQCACGAVLEGATGELLLAAVERHAAGDHVDALWRGGPSLDDLRRQVAGLGRRLETLEQSLGTTARRAATEGGKQ